MGDLSVDDIIRLAKAEDIVAARARGEMTSIECVDRLIAALTRENTDGH